MYPPCAPDGLLEGGSDLGAEAGQGLLEGLVRDPGGGQVHAVEAGGVLADGGGAAVPHVLAEGADLRDGRLDVGGGAGQEAG